MLEICGVAPEKFRIICLGIDKLDKQAFEQVKKEMVEEKVLSETADIIGNFVKEKGAPLELFTKLRQEESELLTNKSSTEAVDELKSPSTVEYLISTQTFNATVTTHLSYTGT